MFSGKLGGMKSVTVLVGKQGGGQWKVEGNIGLH